MTRYDDRSGTSHGKGVIFEAHILGMLGEYLYNMNDSVCFFLFGSLVLSIQFNFNSIKVYFHPTRV